MTLQKIDSTLLGLISAFSIAVMWSIYCLFDFLVLLMELDLSTGHGYQINDLIRQEMLCRYVLILIALCVGFGATGTVIAELYNICCEKFNTKLP